MRIENLLHEEIEKELHSLEGMDTGSDEYKIAVDGLTKLVDRAIEIDKFNNECEEKSKERKFEEDMRIKQLEEDKKDRLIKNVIAGAGIAVPSVITVWGTLKSLKFEETGTITTAIGRGFINKLLPKK
jgi:hypothetical protein